MARKAAGKRPEFRVFVSRKGEGDKSYYTEVGAAWRVANDGISIRLHALPLDGNLVLFKNEPKES